MWYWVKTPLLVKKIFPNQIWDIPSELPFVYLTFDDGPTIGITEKILAILKSYNAKATFFCVGNNVQKQPKEYQKIIDQGHSVGNHTMTHPMGWGKSKKLYLKDIKKAEELINSNLFRPPYGKINFKSNKTLQKRFKIIMWDVVGGDFDPCHLLGLVPHKAEEHVVGAWLDGFDGVVPIEVRVGSCHLVPVEEQNDTGERKGIL